MKRNETNFRMNLKEICLESVCSNLYLNYVVCKYNLWKIPSCIADSILEYFARNSKIQGKNDLFFFRKDITSIGKVIITSKLLPFLNILSEIDKNSVKEVKIFIHSLNQSSYEGLMEILSNSFNVEKLSIAVFNEHKFSDIFNGFIPSSSNLKEINLPNFNLDEIQCQSLGQLFHQCDRLEKINISENVNMKHGFVHLCKQLKFSSDSLREIDFCYCYLDDGQTKALANLLQKCSNLCFVNLAGNPFPEMEFQALCRGLCKSCHSLEIILFGECKLTEVNCIEIGKFLNYCQSIKEIELFNNRSMNNGLIYVFDGICQSSSVLNVLNLSSCNLNESHCKQLKALLENCSNIQLFNISYNKNCGNGFTDICQGLIKSGEKLKKVFMVNCDLNEEQGTNVGKLLESCSSIQIFTIAFNPDMNNGSAHVINGLKRSQNTLKNVDFCSCNLTQEDCIVLGRTLEYCPNIDSINLGGNKNMSNGFSAVCQGLLKSKRSLSNIYLRNCTFSEKQGEQLGSLLSKCTCIECVNISFNPNMENGLKIIANGLLNSSYKLQYVFIENCQLSQEERLLFQNLFKNQKRTKILL